MHEATLCWVHHGMFQCRRCLIPLAFCSENCSPVESFTNIPWPPGLVGNLGLGGPWGDQMGPGLHRVDFTQLGLQRNEAMEVWLPQPTLRHHSPDFPSVNGSYNYEFIVQLEAPWGYHHVGPLGISSWTCRRLAMPRYRADVGPVSATAAAISRM